MLRGKGAKLLAGKENSSGQGLRLLARKQNDPLARRQTRADTLPKLLAGKRIEGRCPELLAGKRGEALPLDLLAREHTEGRASSTSFGVVLLGKTKIFFCGICRAPR